MNGETIELQSYFFEIMVDILREKGKILDNSEVRYLEDFFNRGVQKRKNEPNEFWSDVEVRLKDKVEAMENISALSIRDILRKLCPLDPFC